MKKLDRDIKKNGYFYSLVKRSEYVAIYKQCETDGGPAIAFEVFEIASQKAGETRLKDGTVIVRQEKELFPSNESFGRTAWVYKTFGESMMQFEKLKRKVEERKIEKSNKNES